MSSTADAATAGGKPASPFRTTRVFLGVVAPALLVMPFLLLGAGQHDCACAALTKRNRSDRKAGRADAAECPGLGRNYWCFDSNSAGIPQQRREDRSFELL
jgi:hypothetical protein